MADGTALASRASSAHERKARAAPRLRRGDRPLLRAAIVGAATLALMADVVPGTAHASGAKSPEGKTTSLSVSPDRGLVDDEWAKVRVSNGAYGTTYAVVECDPTALSLLAVTNASLQDGCDSRHNTLMTIGASHSATTSLKLAAVLTTSLGGADCLKEDCFLAAVALHSTGGALLLVASLGFAANACAAPGSCTPPGDSWDPTLGPPPVVTNGGATAPSQASAAQAPLVVALQPALAGDLTAPGSVTGPYTGQPLTGTATTETAAVPGEGLLRLAMESPGTSWGPGPPSSTVVDATLTDVTDHEVVGSQQFVLFWGRSPFVYAGFAGPVVSSHQYSVRLTADPDDRQGGLSQPLPGQVPRVELLASALEVVRTANPQYLAYAYAPVMYGRSTSALHDVPLLAYANAVQQPDGSTDLSYTIVWSHEDGGTGFLPFLEWGMWGRMTDIEDAISFTVERDGAVVGATYLWGGEPPHGFPDSQTALQETDKAFAGTWWGHHPVIRDATGNNDFSDQGTSRFRFQLAPVAPPPVGAARDAVMDMNPFTYVVMSEEVARWYADGSTSPSSPEPGEAQQYAIVDLDTTGRGVSSVAVGLRLSGYPQWFRNDLGWDFPLVGTGHVRTVVKLPLGWQSGSITGVRVEVGPPSAASSLTVRSLEVERFTGATVEQVRVPPAEVGPATLAIAPS